MLICFSSITIKIWFCESNSYFYPRKPRLPIYSSENHLKHCFHFSNSVEWWMVWIDWIEFQPTVFILFKIYHIETIIKYKSWFIDEEKVIYLWFLHLMNFKCLFNILENLNFLKSFLKCLKRQNEYNWLLCLGGRAAQRYDEY